MRSLGLVVAPILLVLLAPERVDASGCFVGPYSIAVNPPLGCEVVVLSHADYGPTSFAVTAQRGPSAIDVTGAVTSSITPVDVAYANYECDGSVREQYTRAEDYNVYRITLTGAQVGDHLSINGMDSGIVQASGTCSEDMTAATPACTAVNSGYACEDTGSGSGSGSGSGDGGGDGSDSDDDVGCNAGASGLGALALLALCGLSRRRRAR